MTPGEEALWSQAHAYWVIASCVLVLTVALLLVGVALLWGVVRGRISHE